MKEQLTEKQIELFDALNTLWNAHVITTVEYMRADEAIRAIRKD